MSKNETLRTDLFCQKIDQILYLSMGDLNEVLGGKFSLNNDVLEQAV